MRNELAHERYIVEVDGIAKAEYPIFVCALKASLQLKQELPNCRVKLRDASRKADAYSAPATRRLTKLHRCRLPLVNCYLSATV